MTHTQDTPVEISAWDDAATAALCRGLERTGHLRSVMAELTPAERDTVQAAWDRDIIRRRNGS